MSCTVHRNSNKEITKVDKQNGKESKLFKSIASHPLIQSTEEALSAYKNIYTSKIKDVSEDEISLTHKVGDKIFGGYKEALQEAVEGQSISIRLQVGDKFYPILSVNKNTDKSSEVGFVQNQILDNNIAEKRIKVGNKYYLQPQGEADLRKLSSLVTIQNEAINNLGSNSIKVSGFTIELTKTLGKVTVYTKDGVKDSIDADELDALSLDELRDRFDNYEEIYAERMYKERVPIKRENTLPTNQPTIKTESEIKIQLLTLLKSMGVKVVSMSNYLDKYTFKNGVNPNANALADIANQVVAITIGQETIENLREETVHFILEAIPQERLEDILRNIHKTEEYKQHAELYTAVYEKEYSAEELDMAVRKEILAKIVINALAQETEVSESKQNFFDSALNAIADFFKNAVNFFKPQYIADLNNLTADIQNMIESGDVSSLDLNNFEGNNKRFYNLDGSKSKTDALIKESKKQVDILTRQNNDLERNSAGSKTDRGGLKRVQKALDNALEVGSVAKIVQIVENSVNRLEAALLDSKNKNKTYDLSQEEIIIYKNLIGETFSGIGVMKELIDTNDSIKDLRDWKILSNTISEVAKKITSLKAKRAVTEQESIERQIRAVTTDRGLSEREYEAMLRWTVAAENEISVFTQTFSTLNGSLDSLMSLFATLKTGMLSEGSRADHNEIKALQTIIAENGFDEKVISTFVKDGYFMSERNIAEYLKQLDDNFLSEYKKVFPQEKLKDEDILKARAKGDLKWTEEQEALINKATSKLNESFSERRMSKEYYRELEEKYVRLDISQNTQDILREINADKNKVLEKARNENGNIDLTTLDLQDLQQLKTRQLDRKQLKSVVDETGALKVGLKYTTDINGEITVVNSVPLEDLSLEARTALDINKLDGDFKKTNQKDANDRPQSFDDLVLSKDSREEQIAALLFNANLGFTEEFWKGFGENESIKDRLLKVKDNSSDDKLNATIDVIIEGLEENKLRLKALIKGYTQTNNPSETDVESMSSLTKDSIRLLEEQQENLRKEAREITKDIDKRPNTNLIEGVSGTNESWNNRLKDLDINISEDTTPVELNKKTRDIIEEAKKNMTTKNKSLVEDVIKDIEKYNAGLKTNLSKLIVSTLESQGLTEGDLLDSQIKNKFILKFAEDRLLSYYKRFTPQGYVEFQRDLNNEDIEVSEILNKEYEFVQITPNYSFQDEDISNVNPNYISGSGMGVQQPSAEKYKNTEFENTFGKVVRDKDGDYISSEKNEKLFNVYKATMAMRKSQISKMEGGASYNIYMTPQIRKQNIERYLGSIRNISRQSFKDAWENIKTYTEDDLEFGDNRLGTANKSIPKPYFARLENQTDISTDIFHSLAVTNKEANIYQMRVKYFGDAMALMDSATKRSNPNGKEPTSTNRYKMLESAFDNDFYGIKQSTSASANVPFIGKVDAGKVVNGLGAILRFKGLGGSVIIPATAFLTGKTKQTVERIVGQYINSDSYNSGSVAYNKLIVKAVSEINSLRTVTPLNAMGQFWGAFELEHSLYGANFNAVKRLGTKIPMILYQAANYPLYGKGLLTVLHDFRIVDGQLVKFTDFQRNQRLANLKVTNTEIQESWKKEKVTIYDLQDVKEDGQVGFKVDELKKLLKNKDGQPLSEEELSKEILRFSNDIRIQVKNLNVRIDMQLSHEDKVAANRSYFLNFLMMFKGFMVVLANERFKPEGYNIQSRQLESGSYSGIYKMFGDIVIEWKQNGNNFMEAFKNQYYGDFSEQESRIAEIESLQNKTPEQEAELKGLKEDVVRGIEKSDLRKSNLKRLGVDLLIINSIIVIAMLLKGMADDDKEKSNYILQLAALLSYRVAGEVHSANTGIAAQYWETAKAPLQAFDQVVSLEKLLHNKSWKEGKVMSSIGKFAPFANSINQLTDPGTALDNKVYYTEEKDNALWSIPAYHFFTKDKN